ncbi:hypothetical protein GQ651_04000 [Alphaproteobacteria bacterium GH1-50]|uniref:TspO/MBR related protein n=2 Tax=Kangsaoukella pontilimi TaxID=2691042 RepID=A0A7C9IES6_9RHOB|nr:hypothetical protein [Kangsaoukella pontilimi]
MNTKAAAVTVLVLAIAFAGSSVVFPFAGFEPDAFPIPQNDPPAQPAGYAFSIWLVIYLWLILSAAYGVLRRADDPAWAATRAPLMLSLGIGMFWLWAASVSPILATLMIWAMLVTGVAALAESPATDRWLLRGPIGLYAGWLAAASCVSVALLGAGYGFGFSQTGWAYAVVLAAALGAIGIIAWLGRVHEFGLAVAWALVAIAVKSANTAPGLATTAGIAAAGVGIVVAMKMTSTKV